MNRLRLALAGVTIACAAVVAPAATAPVAAAPACSGVTVVVDFGHWGGAFERGCAADPTSGLDALHDAGFSTVGTAQFGNAYVCRIDNLPPPEDEACVVTPPTHAHWSYFYAKPGDASWTFSTIGATARKPPRGSIEGWAFGNNARPRLSPAEVVPAPPPPPPPTNPPKPQGTPDPSPSGGNAGTPVAPNNDTPAPGGTRPNANPATSVPSASTVAPSTDTTARTSTTVAGRDRADGGDVPIVERSAVAKPDAKGDSGSPLPLVITVIVVAGVGTAGFVMARRRGRSAP